MTSNEKQSRKQRRAAERAARKGGATSSAKTSSSGGRSGPSILVISIGAIAIGVVAVLALVLIFGGGDDAAAAVSEPDTPAPAEELREGRTLVAQEATAPVEILLFEDAQCPHCQTFTERVEPLIIAEHVASGNASLTYSDYIIFGEESLDAAVAMRAAEELDGAFWDYHHSLYYNAPEGAFTREWLADIAESIGLDRDEFTALLDDSDLQDAVAAEHAVGSGLGVASTPSVVVDGQLLVAPAWEDINEAILAAVDQAE
jgi:protein-disulfide isomerase